REIARHTEHRSVSPEDEKQVHFVGERGNRRKRAASKTRELGGGSIAKKFPSSPLDETCRALHQRAAGNFSGIGEQPYPSDFVTQAFQSEPEILCSLPARAAAIRSRRAT